MRRPSFPILALALLACLAPAAIGLGATGQESPADLQFDYAEGLYRDGIRKMAIGELAKFLGLYPKDPRASRVRFYLGECQYANDDYKAALDAYEAAAKDEGLAARPIVLYRIGDCRFRLGQVAGAVEPLRQFLDAKLLTPDHRRFIVHARYTLARAEFAQRRFAEALPLFEQVLVDPAPENTYKAYVLLPIGDCLVSLGKPADALARYRELEAYVAGVLKAKPDIPDAAAQRELLARVRTKMAGLLLTGKKYEEALAVFGLQDTSGTFGEEVLYGRAQALFFLQRYQEALVPTLEYLKRFPQGEFAPSALYLAGEACYRTNRFPEAEQHFADLLARDKEKKNPARESAAFGRAAAAYRQGKDHASATASAADLFLKEFPNGPRCADVVYFQAEAAFWLGQHAAALEAYRKVPVGNPFAEAAAHQVAVCLDLLKRHEEAVAAYDGYLKRYPAGERYQSALDRAARLWGQLNQYAKAAQRYGEFVDKYAKADPKVAEEFLYRKGACEYEAKQVDAMYKTFKDYFDRFRDGPHKGDVHYFLAWYCADQKQEYEAAIPLYELCANLPGVYQKRALRQLAHTYNKLGKARLAAKDQKGADECFAKAAETFLQAIRKAPEALAGPDEYLWTAEVFRELRRNSEAIETYESLIQRYPAEAKPTAIYWLGELALSLEKPDAERARKYFNQFLDKFPNHEYVIWAKFGLAETLKGAADHQGAWQWYSQVEQLAPHVLDNATTRDALILKCQLQMGRMAFDDKNWEFARKYLLRVGYLASGEIAAEALHKAGSAAVRLNDPDSAIAIFQRLLRLYPKSPWAERFLKEADQLGLQLAADGKAIQKKPQMP